MAKIKLTSIDPPSYPLEKYVEELIELIEKILASKDALYEVPYDELQDIYLELDDAPDESIEVFSEKYAYAQSHYNRVSYILMQVKKELKKWQMYKNQLKILYRRARNLLLVNRVDIKALRNQGLQDAAIQHELMDVVDLLEMLDGIVEGIKYDIDIVSIKLDTLDKAILNLSRQQKVVEDEMALNGVIGVRGARVKIRT